MSTLASPRAERTSEEPRQLSPLRSVASARIGGVTYLVNGLGGAHEYEFKTPIAGSEFRYNEKHGAQLAEATPHALRLTFVNVDGARIDEVVLER